MTTDSTLPTSRLEVGKPHVTLKEVHDGRLVRQIWVEIRVDPEWVAVYCLVAQDGRLVLAEAKLCPYEEDARAGEWSPQSVPTGGLPFGGLRELHTDSVLQALREFLEYVEDECDGRELLEHVFRRWELDRGLVLSEQIPRRRRRTDTDVARAAAICAREPRGDWVQAVADEIPCSERTAYRLIGDARDRGLLDGDELTERAHQILGS